MQDHFCCFIDAGCSDEFEGCVYRFAGAGGEGRCAERETPSEVRKA
jgi:hypothetical protein